MSIPLEWRFVDVMSERAIQFNRRGSFILRYDYMVDDYT